RPAVSTARSASAASSGRLASTSRAALACTTIRLTWWLTMSCRSCAIRARSASTAVRAARSRSRSSSQPRSSSARRYRRRARASARPSQLPVAHAATSAAAAAAGQPLAQVHTWPAFQTAPTPRVIPPPQRAYITRMTGHRGEIRGMMPPRHPPPYRRLMTRDGSEDRTVVRLDGVRKEYGDTTALAGVSLQIRAGEAVAVMGPSGCGKSTLLNLIAGLDRPTSGTVVVHGEDLGAKTETALALFRRHRIGMIFQFFNLLDDLPALDNVALAAQLTGTPARQARRRALELLDELEIADRRNTYPAALSGGERQRVAVARALMNRPGLLLADEPTGALDSRSGEQVMDLLIDLNQIGQTLLLVTHDPRLAERCASRVVELGDGRVARGRALEVSA